MRFIGVSINPDAEFPIPNRKVAFCIFQKEDQIEAIKTKLAERAKLAKVHPLAQPAITVRNDESTKISKGTLRNLYAHSRTCPDLLGSAHCCFRKTGEVGIADGAESRASPATAIRPPVTLQSSIPPKQGIPLQADPISDSGYVTGVSASCIKRGSRASHSDFNFSESYL